jgi:DNA-directed RNA polymerase specialized sigma24 family protein
MEIGHETRTADRIARHMRRDIREGLILLVKEYGGRVLGGIQKAYGILDESEDVLQEVCRKILSTKTFESWWALHESGEMQGFTLPIWFYRLADFAAKDIIRRKGPTRQALSDDPEDHSSVREENDGLRSQLLAQAITELSPKRRLVIEADLNSCSVSGKADTAALAEAMDCSVASVHSIRYQAHNHIRHYMLAHGFRPAWHRGVNNAK